MDWAQWLSGALSQGMRAELRNQPGFEIDNYLDYIVKICTRAIKYKWEDVRAFDDAYRREQAATSFQWGYWGDELSYMRETFFTHLRHGNSKVTMASASKSSTKSLRPRPRGNQPISGYCQKFNDKECFYPATKCRFRHFCNICDSPDHADVECSDIRAVAFGPARAS
jgi:hypothetical protein